MGTSRRGRPCRLSSLSGAVLVGAILGGLLGSAGATQEPDPSAAPASADYVVLFVLEGFDQDSLGKGRMPVASRLVKEGAVSWTATAVLPAGRLPTMASIFLGLPVEKHGIDWDKFELARGYPRPPTMFDYFDLSGGRDAAIFFMDESLYQLAKPEPYTDYQICGRLRPECTPDKLVQYIRQYFEKASSGEGYGHAISALPHVLVVHLPAPARAGEEQGWTSKAYQDALTSVDRAMGTVLTLYKDLGLLGRTTVFVTTLSGGQAAIGDQGSVVPRVAWIASGSGIKSGHAIARPVSIIDTGATIMRTLGLETYTEWDSRAVEEIFRPDPAPTVVGQVREGTAP